MNVFANHDVFICRRAVAAVVPDGDGIAGMHRDARPRVERVFGDDTAIGGQKTGIRIGAGDVSV